MKKCIRRESTLTDCYRWILTSFDSFAAAAHFNFSMFHSTKTTKNQRIPSQYHNPLNQNNLSSNNPHHIHYNKTHHTHNDAAATHPPTPPHLKTNNNPPPRLRPTGEPIHESREHIRAELQTRSLGTCHVYYVCCSYGDIGLWGGE